MAASTHTMTPPQSDISTSPSPAISQHYTPTMSYQSSCESSTTDDSSPPSPVSPTHFARGVWGAQSRARASTSDLPPRPLPRPILPLRASSELPPALPESPEILVATPRVTPNIPRSGTLRPSSLSGLQIQQPPQSASATFASAIKVPHAQPRKVVLQPRRASTSSQSSQQDPLGRRLPPTLTESLELLVQVQDHCRELERLHSVPEEPVSPSKPFAHQMPYMSLPKRKSSANLPLSLPPTPVRRTSEPGVRAGPSPRCTSFAAPRMHRTSSGSSVSSGDWPETPTSTSPYSTGAGAMSMPALDFAPVEHIASTADMKMRSRTSRAMRALSTTTVDGRPSIAKLLYASELQVIGEDNEPVKFGELLDGPGQQRTIVVFVRHWLSPSCGTYLKALISQLTPQVLARARARVIVIGIGAASMIKGYRTHFQCPFPVYTDPGRKLHDVLGLAAKASGSSRSEYATGTMRAARDMLLCAARMQGVRAGNRQQLGGEFIFEGPLQVLTAHQMVGQSDHMPVSSLIDALSAPPRKPVPSPAYAPRTPTSRLRRNTRTPPGSRSCISLNEAPPLPANRLEFPLPPLPKISSEDVGRWERQMEKRLSAISMSRRSRSASLVATVHPDNVDRITGEVGVGI